MSQAFHRTIEVLWRSANVSNKPSPVDAGSSGDIAECRVSQALLVPENPRYSGSETGTRAEYSIHHEERVIIRGLPGDGNVPDVNVNLLFGGRNESFDRAALQSRRRYQRKVKSLPEAPPAKKVLDSPLDLCSIDIADDRQN